MNAFGDKRQMYNKWLKVRFALTGLETRVNVGSRGETEEMHLQ